MGRPKKQPSEKRTVSIPVMWTAAERARLLADVEKYGLPSLSELIRQRSLTGRVVVKQTTELAAADRVELNRLGVNLNQIARHLNEAGADSLPALAEIEADLRAALERINLTLLRVDGGGQ